MAITLPLKEKNPRMAVKSAPVFSSLTREHSVCLTYMLPRASLHGYAVASEPWAMAAWLGNISKLKLLVLALGCSAYNFSISSNAVLEVEAGKCRTFAE